jgi:hypothetical protein
MELRSTKKKAEPSGNDLPQRMSARCVAFMASHHSTSGLSEILAESSHQSLNA